MHHAPAERHEASRLDIQIIVFGLALIATYLLAAFVPDLVPQAARTGLAQFAHGRVVSIIEPAPQPTEAPLPSDLGPAPSDGGSGGDGSGGDGSGGPPPMPPQAVVELLDGPRAGQQIQGLVQGPSGSLQLPDYRRGDDVVVEIDPQPDGTSTYAIVDRWRVPLFGALVGLLTVLAAAVAGWRGLRAVVSLALTLVLTVRLFVPLVIVGWSPVPLAVGFGIVVTVLSFALTQGFNRTTTSAVLGTTFGLLITGALAAVVTEVARFTPAQGSDEVVYLQQATNGTIDLSGLLLAAVIFGGLGLLNDVAISQAATVEELQAVDGHMAPFELFRRTMNIGTAHLAATINTLVFAYLGTALPLVVLLVLQASNAGAVVSLESVAVEITRTIIGAVGIVAAVPITTAIAVRLVRPQDGGPAQPTRAAVRQARPIST
ncbi:MAG: YibE/F family protein, partial [Chloroflexota bacterium]